MSTKTFKWGTAEVGATGATGFSAVMSTPNPYKAVQAFLDAAGTSATVEVYGSIDGGVHLHLLDTLTLTGANGEDSYEGTNAFDSLVTKITAVTGTVTAMCRYAHN